MEVESRLQNLEDLCVAVWAEAADERRHVAKPHHLEKGLLVLQSDQFRHETVDHLSVPRNTHPMTSQDRTLAAPAWSSGDRYSHDTAVDRKVDAESAVAGKEPAMAAHTTAFAAQDTRNAIVARPKPLRYDDWIVKAEYPTCSSGLGLLARRDRVDESNCVRARLRASPADYLPGH